MDTCKCGHLKEDHGDDPDQDGYNVCDDPLCPCGAYRSVEDPRPMEYLK